MPAPFGMAPKGIDESQKKCQPRALAAPVEHVATRSLHGTEAPHEFGPETHADAVS